MTNIDRVNFAKTDMGTIKERKEMLKSFKVEMQIHKKIQRLLHPERERDPSNKKQALPAKNPPKIVDLVYKKLKA